MNKKVTGILVVMAIVGILGLFYFLPENSKQLNREVITSNEDKEETDSWVVYTHDKLGFSIKYPDDEIVIDKELEEDGVMFTFSKYAELKDYPPTGLQILRRGNFGEDVMDVITSDSTAVEDGKKIIPEHEWVQINNAFGAKTSRGFSSEYNYYVNDKGNSGYPLRIFAYSGVDDDIEIFYTMVKTFEFTR